MRRWWLCACLLLLGALSMSAQMGWSPVDGDALVRQGPRAFAIGAASGGAGGGSSRTSPGWPGRTPLMVRTAVAPLSYWDTHEGPGDKALPEGVVRFYREGEYSPSIEAELGVDVEVPPGRWYVMAEAPGWVTPISAGFVTPETDMPYSRMSPVVPACRLEIDSELLPPDPARVDVVSLAEATVFPWTPGEAPARHVPVGSYLVYVVRDAQIVALGGVQECTAGGETVALRPVSPPSDTRWDLVLHLDLPRTDPGSEVTVQATVAGKPIEPVGEVEINGRLTLFFRNLAVEDLTVQVGEGGATKVWRGTAGTVLEAEWARGVDPSTAMVR